MIDNVELLSKISNSIFATALLNVFVKGFTGRMLKTTNKIKGPHRFTGQIHQMGVPTLICLCLCLCLFVLLVLGAAEAPTAFCPSTLNSPTINRLSPP